MFEQKELASNRRLYSEEPLGGASGIRLQPLERLRHDFRPRAPPSRGDARNHSMQHDTGTVPDPGTFVRSREARIIKRGD